MQKKGVCYCGPIYHTFLVGFVLGFFLGFFFPTPPPLPPPLPRLPFGANFRKYIIISIFFNLVLVFFFPLNGRRIFHSFIRPFASIHPFHLFIHSINQ